MIFIFKLKNFIIGKLNNNCYLLEKNKEVILIDCPDGINEVINYLKKNNLTPNYCLITHGHFDHIGGVFELRKAFPNIKVVGSELDQNWLEGKYNGTFGVYIKPVKLDLDITKLNKINLENFNVKIIHVPGHTKGSLCYLIDNSLFTGDTLFFQSIGRCDLQEGNYQNIIKNIKNKLYTLDLKTKVYPGHGRETTIETEKNFNPFTNNPKEFF